MGSHSRQTRVTPIRKSTENLEIAMSKDNDVVKLNGRRCTDIPFLLLLILCWAGMSAVSYYAVGQGNINRQGARGKDKKNLALVVQHPSKKNFTSPITGSNMALIPKEIFAVLQLELIQSETSLEWSISTTLTSRSRHPTKCACLRVQMQRISPQSCANTM